ncbi:MAG: helix-turn-helix domain-containing protein, partial [Clostridia bacterium]|nr:helix-turn-helix domain-containing protein [Clostridia bacterium]
MDREVKNKTMYHALFGRSPDALKPEQVREMLGIGTRMTYRLLKSGEIQSVRMGRIYRVPK